MHVHNPQGLRPDVYTAHSCHAAYIGMRREEGGSRAWLSRVYPPHVADLAFESYCYRSSPALVIALTPVVKQELETHVGLDPERIRVIPNGVDTQAFTPPASRAAARQAVAPLTGELPDDAVPLLFAGLRVRAQGARRRDRGDRSLR